MASVWGDLMQKSMALVKSMTVNIGLFVGLSLTGLFAAVLAVCLWPVLVVTIFAVLFTGVFSRPRG